MPQNPAPVQIDTGELLTLLTLGEKSCRDAREAACVKQQLDIQIRASKSQIALAGAGALAQIQNGSRVPQAGDADDPLVQAAAQHQAMLLGSLDNIIGIGEVLKKKLGRA